MFFVKNGNMEFIKEKREGNIFLIPLYLPAYQSWRNNEDLINYGKYKFHEEDNYAFGRIIDKYDGGGDLVEIFSYVGKIPENPTAITASGRLFEPVHISLAFSKKRYPFIFSYEQYDKYKDSDYQNIAFLLVDKLWKGGEKIEISEAEKVKLQQSGIPWWIIYTSTQIEERIRTVMENKGIELNYDGIVEQRKDEFPVPREADSTLKKKIVPFLWNVSDSDFFLFLDIGSFRQEWFAEKELLGNGYDWQQLFLYFVEASMPQMIGKFVCDSESGTFSISCTNKKHLKSLAIAFRNFCDNENDFKTALSKLKQTR